MPMLWHKNKTLITLIEIAIARLLVYIALPCLVSGFRDDQTKFDYLDYTGNQLNKQQQTTTNTKPKTQI